MCVCVWIREFHLKRQKTNVAFPKSSHILQSTEDIYTKQGLRDKKIAHTRRQRGRASGGLGSCQRLGSGGGGFQNGKYGRRLAVRNPQWGERLIGNQIYQYELVIIREYWDDAKGGKINSRETVGENAKKSWGGDGETGNRSQ